jgi:hypothetical protein
VAASTLTSSSFSLMVTPYADKIPAWQKQLQCSVSYPSPCLLNASDCVQQCYSMILLFLATLSIIELAEIAFETSYQPLMHGLQHACSVCVMFSRVVKHTVCWTGVFKQSPSAWVCLQTNDGSSMLLVLLSKKESRLIVSSVCLSPLPPYKF